jgi:plasmid stabilization system protein ParE
MTAQVFFRADALSDVESSQEWYESQRPGLGDRFARTVTHSAELIGMWPESHAIIWRNVRAYKLTGFPYVIYYRIRSEYVEVIAVLHGRRDESAWKSRSSPN